MELQTRSPLISTFKAIVLIFILVILGWFLYKPGFNGGFIFDDYHSLKKLAVFEGEITGESLKTYLGLSDTGILKRPISVLSFLIDGQNWPVEPYSFKRTNVIFHLLIGILLFWLIRKVIGQHSTHSADRNFIAIVSTSIWVLHPFFVSTTLYIVQRMAMLPVLFMLLGMLSYFTFRVKNSIKKASIYEIGMVISVFGATIFAVFSKENGVLVLPLIFLFEALIVRKYLSFNPLRSRIKLVIFTIPSCVIFLAFIYMTIKNLDVYDVRMFSPFERLLTEFRVLTDYLNHLLIPKYFTYGVFADGFKLSTGIFKPISTFFSIIFILGLIVLAWLIRNKMIWLSFVTFFFFIALSIESTFIPLEIYYEHRTYLATVFMGVPFSFILLKLVKRNPIFYLIPVALICFISFLTFLRVQVWQDNFKLHEMTMQKFPESERAITMTADYYARSGYKNKTLQLLDQAIYQHNSLALHFNRLQYLCGAENTDYYQLDLYFESAIEAFKTESFNMTSMVAFTSIFRKLLRNECKTGKDMEYATQFYKSLFLHKHSGRKYSKLFQTAYGMHYFLEKGEIDKGKEEIKKLIFQYHRYYDAFEGLDTLYERGEYQVINELLADLRKDYELTKGIFPDLKGWKERINSYQQIINEKNE
ncbi:MAG: hypothetical protein KDI92_06435 [Xanthomonadales bacterium]|nr:hypothetical protein [Xanthomonadales bacterium]